MREAPESRLIELMSDDHHWVVLRTKPRQERLAEHTLRHRRIVTYLPLFLEPPWHPRAPKGPMPLFASYLFVHCRPSERLSAIRFAPGVLRPLTFDGKLATVSQEVIDHLRLREGDRGYILPDEIEQGLSSGQKVQIMAGALAGLRGIFRGYLRGGQRVQLLMEFLCAPSSVELDAQWVAPVRAS